MANSEKLNQLFTNAQQLVNEGKGGEAVASFISARKMADESRDMVGLAEIDHRLSVIYATLGDNESAAKYARQAVSTFEAELAKVGDESSLTYRLLQTKYMPALVAYGIALEGKDDYEQALQTHQKATKIVRGFSTANDLNVLPCLAGVARTLVSLERYEEAEPIWNEILSIRKQKLTPDHNLIGAAQVQLGRLYMFTGKHADARMLLEAGLAIARNHNLNPETAESVAYLAQLEHQDLRLDKALAYCKQYIDICQALGTDSNGVSGWIREQAQWLCDLRRKPEAAALLEKEARRLEPAWKSSATDFISTLCMLADVWLSVGDFQQSALWINRAEEKLQEIKNIQGAPEGRTLAPVLLQRARLLELQLDFERAVAVYRNVWGLFADNRQWKLEYSLPLSRVLILAKRCNDAIELLYPLSSEKYLHPHYKFGVERALTRAYILIGRVDECSAWLEAADKRLAHARPEQGDDSWQSDYHIDLALLSAATNKPDAAEVEFKCAVNFVETNYGTNHPYLSQPLHYYREWCEANGRLDQAVVLKDRIGFLRKKLEDTFPSISTEGW